MLPYVGIWQSTLVLQQGISANDFVIWTVYVLSQNRQNTQNINWFFICEQLECEVGAGRFMPPCYLGLRTVIVDLLLLRGFFQKRKYSPPTISQIHILEPQLFFFVWLIDGFYFMFFPAETVTVAGHMQYLRMWKCMLKSSKVNQPSWRISGSKDLFDLPLIGGNHGWSWRISAPYVCCIWLAGQIAVSGNRSGWQEDTYKILIMLFFV